MRENTVSALRGLVCGAAGFLGGLTAWGFGAWDGSINTLVLFMMIDYISGLVVAGVFHRSKKTESGALQSRAGWKGLCRKGMTLLLVMVGHRLDVTIGTTYIREAFIIGFMANEVISIIENAGLMGLQLPSAVQRAIDVLTQKAEEEHK